MSPDEVDFRSPSERAVISEVLAYRLHARNCTSEERGYVWHLAVSLQKVAWLAAMMEDGDLWRERDDFCSFDNLSKEKQNGFLSEFLFDRREIRSRNVPLVSCIPLERY